MGFGVPQNITLANDVLLEDYQPGLQKLFNTATILRDRIAKKKVKVGGRYFNYGIEATRNESVGGRYGAGGTTTSATIALMPSMPTAGSVGYDASKFYPIDLYGTFAISGALMASDDRASLIDALDKETRGCTSRMMEEQNVQAWGYGTHAVGKILSGGGTGTLVLSTVYPYSGTKYIRAGMRLVANSTANTSGQQLVVATVTHSTNTITVTAEQSSYSGATAGNVSNTANDDYLYYGEARGTEGSASAEGFGAAIFGILAGSDSLNPSERAYGNAVNVQTSGDSNGYYGSIDRDANAFYQGNVLNGPLNTGSGVGTIDMMQQMIDTMSINQGGECKLILTTHALLRQYVRLAGRLWNETIETIDRGYKRTKYAGIEMIADKHCPSGTMAFLDTDTWDWCETEPLHFQDLGGAVLERVTDSSGRKDAWQGTAVWRGNLACKNPGANGFIYNIDETQGFTA